MSFVKAWIRKAWREGLLLAGLSLHATFAMALSVPQLSMTEAAARLSSGGYVLLMRHAATEGGPSDPASFKLGDCSTQLALSAAGKTQATRIGEAFKTAGVRIDDVASSEYCRCKDTAMLAFGKVSEWPALNFFFSNLKRAEVKQSTELNGVLTHMKAPRNIVWVTHQTNITALTGFVPGAAEVLAVRSAGGKAVAEFRFTPVQ